MKKIMLLVTVMLLMFGLAGCLNNGSTDVSELEDRIEELEKALQQSQADLESARDSLGGVQPSLDQALADLIEAQELIDDLYDQLFELTGVDQRLLSVVQEQKEAIVTMGQEETIINSSFNHNVGSGFFGRILSGPRLNFLSQVSPFEQDGEWQDIQIRYYQMLEEIVQQGYGAGEIVPINEFTFQEPLEYYGINVILNEEYFIEINLDGNETLFSRVLTYDNISLVEAKTIKAKTVAAKFVNSKLQLVFTEQEFDKNEVMTSLRIEDFKEDVGRVIVSFAEDSLYYVNYYVGVNVREDLNAIFNVEFMNGVLNSEQYKLSYIENDTVIENVDMYNVLSTVIGGYNRSQTMLDLYNENPSMVYDILDAYSNIKNESYYPIGITPYDMYSVGEGRYMGLNIASLEPLMSLYSKLIIFNNYLTYVEQLNSTKKAEFDALAVELNAYEYDGTVYDFINYDEETGLYSLIDAMSNLPLSIVNSDGYLNIYDSYVQYVNLLNTENKTLDQHFEMIAYVSKLRTLYEKGNVDIYTTITGQTFVLSNTIPVVYNIEGDGYRSDVEYLISNHSLILNLFPSYYNSTPETISNLLELGILYTPQE